MIRIFSYLAIFMAFIQSTYATELLSEAYCRDITQTKTESILQKNNHLIYLQNYIEDNIYFSCLHGKRAGLTISDFKKAKPVLCKGKGIRPSANYLSEVIHLDLEFKKWFTTDGGYTYLPELHSVRNYQKFFSNSEITLDTQTNLVIPHNFRGNSDGTYDGVMIKQVGMRRNVYELKCYELNTLAQKSISIFI